MVKNTNETTSHFENGEASDEAHPRLLFDQIIYVLIKRKDLCINSTTGLISNNLAAA